MAGAARNEAKQILVIAEGIAVDLLTPHEADFFEFPSESDRVEAENALAAIHSSAARLAFLLSAASTKWEREEAEADKRAENNGLIARVKAAVRGGRS